MVQYSTKTALMPTPFSHNHVDISIPTNEASLVYLHRNAQFWVVYGKNI
jgi:hypothetical protein